MAVPLCACRRAGRRSHCAVTTAPGAPQGSAAATAELSPCPSRRGRHGAHTSARPSQSGARSQPPGRPGPAPQRPLAPANEPQAPVELTEGPGRAPREGILLRPGSEEGAPGRSDRPLAPRVRLGFRTAQAPRPACTGGICSRFPPPVSGASTERPCSDRPRRFHSGRGLPLPLSFRCQAQPRTERATPERSLQRWPFE